MPCAPQLNSQAARDANHGTSRLLVHADLAAVCGPVREALINAAAGHLGLHTPLVMHPRLLVQAGLAAVCLVVTGSCQNCYCRWHDWHAPPAVYLGMSLQSAVLAGTVRLPMECHLCQVCSTSIS
jgi:hypothetical protein